MVVLHANRSLRSSIDATFAMFMRSCMTTINAKVVLNVYNVIAIVASVDFIESESFNDIRPHAAHKSPANVRRRVIVSFISKNIFTSFLGL